MSLQARRALGRHFRRSSNQLPDAGIGNESQALDWYSPHQLAYRIEHVPDELGIMRKEEHAFEHCARGICLADRFYLVLRPLREEVQGGQRRAHVLSRPCEFPSEGSAVGDVSVPLPADVRDFVSEQRGVWRGQARDGGLPCPGGPHEQERAAVTHGAGSMYQQPALFRE